MKGCNNSTTGPVTLGVLTQNGGAFSATSGFTSSVQSVTVVTTFSFSGTFSVNAVSGARVLLQGNGTFAGSVNDAALSASLTGSMSLATGDTCTLTASVSP